MEPSLTTTPVKVVNINCVLCSSSVKRLHNADNNRCRSLNLTKKLEILLNNTLPLSEVVQKINICELCLRYTVDHENKVKVLAENIQSLIDGETRTKRGVGSTTPTEEVSKTITGSHEDAQTVKKKICFGGHDYAQKSVVVSGNVADILQEAESAIKVETPLPGLCFTIEQQLNSISTKNSVLFPKSSKCLSDHCLFSKAVIEFKRVCPTLFRILVVAFSKISNPVDRIATLATVFGMILHSRNNKLSAIQQLFSTIALACNADNRLLTKLNTIHLTLTENSKRTLVKKYGQEADERILQAVSAGHDGKFNGDNLDIRVQTNDVRMTSTDKDYHFFASDFTFDRVNLEGLSKASPKKDNINVSVTDIVPDNNEYQHLKQTLKTLLDRDLIQFEGFSWMRSILPSHIPHQHEDEMSKKSDTFLLPVSLNNEASYQDCIHIMDEYEVYVNKWYSKTGRGEELQSLKVPVGGDQLTRVRLQGAKSLRAGAHTQSERFDHLEPIVIEMFHTLQDFLEKLCKTFIDFSHTRDQGTLQNLKILISRSSVNGNVKSRFKAHEDFVLTCGTAYIRSYVMWKFGMKSMNDIPQHPAINPNIKNMNNEPKRKMFNEIMDEVVADLFIPFNVQEPPQTVQVTIRDKRFVVRTPSSSVMQIPLIINNRRVTITTTKADIDRPHGVTVNALGVDIHLKGTLKAEQNDTNFLKTYVINFLQWYFVVLQMKDCIKEGDMRRTNILLKHMVPFFYSHSSLSKYLVECMDFIIKTEHTLSPYMALKVRASSFVNPNGKQGKNKAADMQKENQVKFLKTLIKSLGANKTEKSIVDLTKAGPVMLEIIDNFDSMTGQKKIKTNHKHKSREEDIGIITDKLKSLSLWDNCQTRLNMRVSQTPYQFDRNEFSRKVESKINLIMLNIPVVEENEDEE